MKNAFKPIALIFVIILLLSACSVIAQEWSNEQKAVWNNIETYYELWIQRDFDGFMEYVHPDYIGWSYSDALPGNKEFLEKWGQYNLKNYSWEIYELKLAALVIIDDVAVAHYYFTGVYLDSEDKKKDTKGRWTDILKKQGDKWVIIGDHGGSIDD